MLMAVETLNAKVWWISHDIHRVKVNLMTQFCKLFVFLSSCWFKCRGLWSSETCTLLDYVPFPQHWQSDMSIVFKTALLQILLRPAGVRIRFCVDDQSNGVIIFSVWTFSDNSLDTLTEIFSVNIEQSIYTAVIFLSRLSDSILFKQNVSQSTHQRIGSSRWRLFSISYIYGSSCIQRRSVRLDFFLITNLTH